MNILLSPLDQKRFKVKTAKASLEHEADVDGAVQWCRAADVEFLVARCETHNIFAAQKMEDQGFNLTDTLVYYRNKKIKKTSLILPDRYSWRLAGGQDREAVAQLSERTFSGYLGHYHADRRLKKTDSDQVYISWAGNSCADLALADAVLLIEYAGLPVAFATQKRVEDYMFEGVLFGVDPAHQGKSLYHALMSLSQNWGLDSGFSQMIVSTQVTNLAVQKVWWRHGFEPFKGYYTFHKWFDEK